VEGARRRGRWDADQVVALASAVGLVAVAAALIFDGPGRLHAGGADAIARLEELDGSVRSRGAGSLVWEPAEPGQGLAAGDVVFAQPGASAAIVFGGGARVELEERSLVVVEPPDAEGQRVRVLAGSVVAAAGRLPLAVGTERDQAVVQPGGAVEVEARTGVQLLEGTARVGGEERRAEPRVALVTPARGHRVYSLAFPVAIALRWDGEAARTGRVEVSRERSFATTVATAPGAGGFLEVAVDAPGPWYWRVSDGRGTALSEVRKVVAVLDRPPRPFAPAPGEIVLAPLGVEVPFWWTAVAGAARYRVEVASDAAFRQVAISAAASGPGLWASLDLPEGIYYWRVRAERPSDGEHASPPSATVAFRLIRRPVLDAPQLFDAAIEGAGHAR
jgi:hypothetical protein